MSTFIIRAAHTEDASALREIYAPYVLNTAITYDVEVPSTEQFRQNIEETSRKYPFLVAESEGRVVGYCCAHCFIPRMAADHSVETTIYVEQTGRNSGVGRALYAELERLLHEQGRRNLYAKITWTDTESPYLTNASSYFHERMGYAKVAHYHRCGYKFGVYFDTIVMEKILS